MSCSRFLIIYMRIFIIHLCAIYIFIWTCHIKYNFFPELFCRLYIARALIWHSNITFIRIENEENAMKYVTSWWYVCRLIDMQLLFEITICRMDSGLMPCQIFILNISFSKNPQLRLSSLFLLSHFICWSYYTLYERNSYYIVFPLNYNPFKYQMTHYICDRKYITRDYFYWGYKLFLISRIKQLIIENR